MLHPPARRSLHPTPTSLNGEVRTADPLLRPHVRRLLPMLVALLQLLLPYRLLRSPPITKDVGALASGAADVQMSGNVSSAAASLSETPFSTSTADGQASANDIG